MVECCGTCKWHRYENTSQGWVCMKNESDYYADWTDYNDSCDEWEEEM